jgi:hypothetical protein
VRRILIARSRWELTLARCIHRDRFTLPLPLSEPTKQLPGPPSHAHLHGGDVADHDRVVRYGCADIRVLIRRHAVRGGPGGAECYLLRRVHHLEGGIHAPDSRQ